MIRRSLPLAIATVLVLSSCAASPRPRSDPSPSQSAPAVGALQPVGETRELATGLDAPWSIVRLGTSDSALVSERDFGTVVERLPSGRLRDIGVVPGVVHAGEGGLLGMAVHEGSPTSNRWLYAYLTTATDNRIVRMPLTGASGWPLMEGIGSKNGFTDPVYQWPTSDASPSGLAFVGGTFFLAALRGERLWAISPGSGTTTALPFLSGSLGRLRDAVPGPHGSLWLLTNNTDGR